MIRHHGPEFLRHIALRNMHMIWTRRRGWMTKRQYTAMKEPAR